MRKRWLSAVMVLALMFGTCRIALAEGAKDAVIGKSLKSHGRIAYQNGEDAVVIDSKDLYMLADQIDLFKHGVSDQLGSMNTYFTTGTGISLTTDEDIHVAHTRPSDENSVDSSMVDFDTLLEGIAASQSVPSEVTAYGYPEGTELYKNKDGMLTANGAEKGAEKLSVTAASADNLSAGTAAWVDGHLILGTGKDNKSCMDNGYKRGLDEGSSGNTVRSIFITANNDNVCVVPEDASGALLYVEGRRNTPSISFASPDGSSVSYTVALSRFCYEKDGSMHRNGYLYYIPKIKAGTVITISIPNIDAYYIYFTK